MIPPFLGLTVALTATAPAATASPPVPVAPATAAPASAATPAPATPGPAPTVCNLPHRSVRLLKPSVFDIPPDAVPDNSFRDVRIVVRVAATGKVIGAKIMQRSGAPKFDAAALKAAETSTYGPKIKNCHPVASGYFYIVQYGSTPAPKLR